MSRASPSTGHGDNMPDPKTYLRALALEAGMQKRKADLREAHKRVRKTIEGAGVVLKDLDNLYKMRDLTPEEAEQWLRRQFAALTALNPSISDAYDLFTPREVLEARGAQEQAGRLAGLFNEDTKPPPGLAGDELQAWTRGFNDGAAARKEAEPVLADILAEALKTADAGVVVDGTGKGKRKTAAQAKADKVAAQAAADFKADNPEGEHGQGETSPDTSAGSPEPDAEGAAERLAAAGMEDA